MADFNPNATTPPDANRRSTTRVERGWQSRGKLHVVAEERDLLALADLVRSLRESWIPPLTVLDIAGLAALAFARKLLQRHHPRGMPVNLNLVKELEGIALTAVHRACPDLLREAGMLSAVIAPLACTRSTATEKYWAWRAELVAAVRSASSRGWQLDLTSRAEFVARFWAVLAVNICDPHQLIGEMRKALSRWKRGVYGIGLSDEERRSEALAAEYRVLAADSPRAALPFVGSDGLFHVNATAVRDAMGRNPRQAGRSPDGTSLGLRLDDGAALLQDPGESPAERAARAEVAALVPRIVASIRAGRAARGGAGRAHAVILSSAEALLAGQVTLTDLARSSGLSISALSEAYTRLREALAREMRRRGVA